MKVYSTSRFDYSKNHKEFVAEASDLSCGNVFSRVYPDACDMGFTLSSHVTGKESDWVVINQLRDNEGDVRIWTLAPTANTLRAMPQLKGVTVTVLND